MPKGIWIRTEKHREKNRETMKKQWANPIFREKRINKIKAGGTTFQKGHQINIGRACPMEKRKAIGLKNKGKIISKKQREQISSKLTGCINPFSPFKKGHTPWNKGKEFIQIKGVNHWNWKSGISFEPYPLGWNKTFKEQIRYRDSYICQKCGVPEIECMEKLHIHHLDLHKSNIQHKNLVSLCRSCHITIHNAKKYRGLLWMK